MAKEKSGDKGIIKEIQNFLLDDDNLRKLEK